jgi:hypothetical protein
MMKVRRFVIYQFLRMIHASYGSCQIPVGVVRSAMCLYDQECSMDGAESIVAILIEAKMVKAYVHRAKQIIVFKQEAAFVDISRDLYPE